ncbi:class I SAM-dependent methyltransferase [Patescibacteria group bacterium]|nr:class I SAM-dependent methyltransferase [Patescibacteria group bacterium]
MEETHAGKALIDPYKVISKMGLKSGMRVADMGCGRTGHFIFSISKIIGETGIIYAVDIMKDVLESIKGRVRSEGYENIQTIWSNVEKPGATPIPADSLDVCMFINVLFGVKERDKAISEALRLLNDGGLLVVIDWIRRLGPLGPSAEKIIKPNVFIDLAAEKGLKLVQNFAAGDYHFCLIFKK